jgi:lipoate-protein ligase A
MAGFARRATGISMRLTCRVLPYESADGPANMALDEVLLDAVSADASAAYLRIYGWTVPTLSLGYFQRLADVQADPRWQSAAVVRRLTGGGAIWHHHEATYALIVPAGHPRARPNTALYRAVHAAIQEILTGAGIAVDRRGDAAQTVRPGLDRPLLCFSDRDSEDLVYRGFKVVGSAQRRRHGAILQHGSVLLARSPRVPELPGLDDLADIHRGPEYWSTRLMEHIPTALDLEPEPVDVSDELRAQADIRASDTYRDAEWTGFR